MCGRQVTNYTWADVHAVMNLTNPHAPPMRPSWNITPSQQIGVVVRDNERDDALSYCYMRWGLIPSWWKKPLKDLPSTINARAETVAEKPMFRTAFKRNRCLIPSSGFYEWDRTTKPKTPYYITMKDEPIMVFAGIYDLWIDPETGEEVLSFAIITCASNEVMSRVHHRMPVVLSKDDWERWIYSPDTDLLQPCPDEWLEMWPVSTKVNSPSFNQAECIHPVEPMHTEQPDLF